MTNIIQLAEKEKELIALSESMVAEAGSRDWSAFSWSENGAYADKMCDLLKESLDVKFELYDRLLQIKFQSAEFGLK
jgi:hypothetical protein